jgi:hypothetical protein
MQLFYLASNSPRWFAVKSSSSDDTDEEEEEEGNRDNIRVDDTITVNQV